MTSTKKQNVRVFIGTSSEQKNSIPVLQGYLEAAGFETLPWTEAFKFGEYTLEALFKAVGETNAAIFLMSLDDKRWYRGKKDDMPRDNLIFEAGLWMSRYGRKHVLILVAARADQKLGLPTDLSGLTFSMMKLGKGNDILPVLKRERKQIRDHFEALSGRDPEPLRLHTALKPLLVHAPENVHYVETVVGAWTHISGSITTSIQSPKAKRLDILAAYQLTDILRDAQFRKHKDATLRVCLSNMYDPELLAIYMRKYRDDTHNEPEIQKRLERSIRAVVGDFSATTKIVKSSGKGKIKVRTSVKNKAKVEVYLTSQRLATSYYRLDDLAWIIPLDVKKSKDPAPMCWGISEGTAPAVFERYQEEFNQILKEAQRVYP